MEKTLEERISIVNDILFGKPMMLMTKPIKKVENKIIGGACTGYEIALNNLSYRGIWLSTLEEVRLTVDGTEILTEEIFIRLGGSIYPVRTLEYHTEVFWGLETDASIVVNKVGGLASGVHTVSIELKKRADFGHTYGEGTEGYGDAVEFLHPAVIADSAEITI